MSKTTGTMENLEKKLLEKLKNFKHVFVTNRPLRNNFFFSEVPVIRKLHSNISVLKNVPLLRTLSTTHLKVDIN